MAIEAGSGELKSSPLGVAHKTLEMESSSSRNSDYSPKAASFLRESAAKFAKQSEKLSHLTHTDSGDDAAVEARFVTPHDPVIVTAEGNRLPAVPLQEAHKLNILREALEETQDTQAAASSSSSSSSPAHASDASSAAAGAERCADQSPANLTKALRDANGKSLQKSGEGSLRRSMPPSHTNPLFPPLPLYGPPSFWRNVQCTTFRVTSFFLSLAFLGVIVLGALFTSIPPVCGRIVSRLMLRDPDAKRVFYEEEKRRAAARREEIRNWRRRRGSRHTSGEKEDDGVGYVPTEGGPDPVKCDVAYYARRVGLDIEEFQVQTEDGFIIDLWHVYDPREYEELPSAEREQRGPGVFAGSKKRLRNPDRPRKFPVLLMHGLLQSSGAYCCNDDDSLAFYLCKSGFDVWLGNNRCGFKPKHSLLKYQDPRLWAWNIRQMGVFDLPALTSRVLYETGFKKIGLVCHSQGTTQTFVALAKEQRPDLGEKLTVFCALAPAAYAGPLIGKMYFKFMRVITPSMFRLMFGIHAFIPFMMTMHRLLPSRIYGHLGYLVFSFLFNWTDERWDRGLRDRMFQFAPVYVSAESMRWWLGRECFARHKCILATKEEWRAEEKEDAAAEREGKGPQPPQRQEDARVDGVVQLAGAALCVLGMRDATTRLDRRQAAPAASSAAGEPHVDVVHSKVVADYEHLDVIWAMDAPTQVFAELREVLWKTCDARDRCRVPTGCEDVAPWTRPRHAGDDDEDGGGKGEF
ncbi:sterol esterase 2 [Magnaporthiopsis poae ATCC 64411]|uniref:Sterol esterase 2 n=1 Tax=Magnaporthiopsis poae (strain ATCC 64411 / 73-15) TaxID=644358 RepID=A0A0C4E2P8_MAGP6|nr:sterol esterase 2 [Magnaporthiopsis poae ATCC 64411]